MINYETVNRFIGTDWVYKENDCWSVFCKASRAIFDTEIHELVIPEKSSPRANSDLFLNNSELQEWEEVDKPLAGCAVLFLSRSFKPVHIGLYIEKGNVLHCPGTVRKPGYTCYENLKQLRLMYKKIRFFKYEPNLRN